MAVRYRAAVLRGAGMNPNYHTTITLFNCLKLPAREVWQKTVLQNCFFKTLITRVNDGVSARMAYTYAVRIPASKAYLSYAQWARLADEERKQHFTCGLNDIVVCGECVDNITGHPPDTAAQVLGRNKPDAFTVTAFSDNSAYIGGHYRLGG